MREDMSIVFNSVMNKSMKNLDENVKVLVSTSTQNADKFASLLAKLIEK